MRGLLHLPILLAFIVFSLSINAEAHEAHHLQAVNVEPKAQPVLGESIYNLKSEWTSQDGQKIHLKDLRGRPLVIAMAYTSCEAACPLIIEDMKKISAGLSDKNRNEFSFLIFSVDSERDTPARLKEYSLKRKLDLKHWQLFNGSENSVRDLAAVLGVHYRKDKKSGDFDHSNVITLIDSEGLIRFQQNGLSQDPKEFLSKANNLNLN